MKVDTLIIGSGVVATVLTKKLLEKNPEMSILILEAGKRFKTKDFGVWTDYVATGNDPVGSQNPMYDYNYPERNIPGENSWAGTTQMPLNGGRAMTYGGSTVVWGGWSLRRKQEDFFLKTNTGEGLDWPFDYEHLEPYYCTAEDYLAVSGDAKDDAVPHSRPYPFRPFPFQLQDQPVANAMTDLGISYMHMPIARRGVSDIPSRHAPCQTTGTCDYCPFGARFVACDYMDDFREWHSFPNLVIKLNAYVTSLRMNGKRKAAGCTYRDTSTDEIVNVDADRVIVAAGTLESAKLLLRSRDSDWPEGVGNDTDNVGRYLITHPYLVFTGTLNLNPLKLQPEMNFPTLLTRYFDTKEQQAAGKFVLVNPPDTVPVSFASMMQQGWPREEIDRTLTGAWPLAIHCMIEVFGRHYNRVTNLPKLSHLGMHQTLVDYSQDDTFPQRVAQVQQIVGDIMQKMGGSLPAGSQPNISWRCDHAASTCRMSVDPKEGVVDADLRVHGVDNLYVCGNAVYPNLGAINPTVTVTALAFRLGDHLNGTV